LTGIQVFAEIDFLTGRLTELGKEAMWVLDQMKNQGVNLDMITDLLAKAKKAERANNVEEVIVDKVKKHRRWWKWWNRGYCWEKEGCAYNHPPEDCKDHLKGGCTTRGCTSHRHRKMCKFFSGETGCHWGDRCQYLHIVDVNVTMGKEVREKRTERSKLVSKEVQTQNYKETVDKKVQTENETKCHCEIECENSEVLMKEDQIILVLKRSKCSENEWKEYEEKVESEMSLPELLEDLGKVIEAASRLSQIKGIK
jgi:hypothetical protein